VDVWLASNSQLGDEEQETRHFDTSNLRSNATHALKGAVAGTHRHQLQRQYLYFCTSKTHRLMVLSKRQWRYLYTCVYAQMRKTNPTVRLRMEEAHVINPWS
jgi:hypothetical protein